MRVEEITELDRFDQLQADWETVYASDQHAQVFISWPWLRSYYRATRSPWRVLAVHSQESQRYVAFLPLVVRSFARGLVRICDVGGGAIADYTGLVCTPEHQQQVLPLLSEHLAHSVRWDQFRTGDFIDPRMEQLCQTLPRRHYRLRLVRNVSSPYLVLPASWEEYLQQNLGASRRQTLRRRIRQLQRLEGFRVTHTDGENLTQQVAVVVSLWQQRWGTSSFDFQSLLEQAFHHDCLWLDVLWQGETPLAALAAFVDREKRSFAYFISGFNPDYAALSPGRVMIAHSIQYAIENDFRLYDFLRGDESYKFELGVKERFTSSLLVTRRTLKNVLISRARDLQAWRRAKVG